MWQEEAFLLKAQAVVIVFFSRNMWPGCPAHPWMLAKLYNVGIKLNILTIISLNCKWTGPNSNQGRSIMQIQCEKVSSPTKIRLLLNIPAQTGPQLCFVYHWGLSAEITIIKPSMYLLSFVHSSQKGWGLQNINTKQTFYVKFVYQSCKSGCHIHDCTSLPTPTSPKIHCFILALLSSVLC